MFEEQDPLNKNYFDFPEEDHVFLSFSQIAKPVNLHCTWILDIIRSKKADLRHAESVHEQLLNRMKNEDQRGEFESRDDFHRRMEKEIEEITSRIEKLESEVDNIFLKSEKACDHYFSIYSEALSKIKRITLGFEKYNYDKEYIKAHVETSIGIKGPRIETLVFQIKNSIAEETIMNVRNKGKYECRASFHLDRPNINGSYLSDRFMGNHLERHVEGLKIDLGSATLIDKTNERKFEHDGSIIS